MENWKCSKWFAFTIFNLTAATFSGDDFIQWYYCTKISLGRTNGLYLYAMFLWKIPVTFISEIPCFVCLSVSSKTMLKVKSREWNEIEHLQKVYAVVAYLSLLHIYPFMTGPYISVFIWNLEFVFFGKMKYGNWNKQTRNYDYQNIVTFGFLGKLTKAMAEKQKKILNTQVQEVDMIFDYHHVQNIMLIDLLVSKVITFIVFCLNDKIESTLGRYLSFQNLV